jgi:hypothetical protein
MALANMFAVGWIPYDNNANDLFPSRLRFQGALSSNDGEPAGRIAPPILKYTAAIIVLP